MSSATVAEAKSQFSDLLRRAEYGGERIVVHRHGKPVAVIVSTADLAQLEALEEAQDVADGRKALKEAAKHGTIPLEAVLKKYRLEHLLDATSGGPEAAAARPSQSPQRKSTRRQSVRPRSANRHR